jgi:hypothetical protein
MLLTIACAAICLSLAPLARAKNIDLTTVPDRQSVQLTIYNGEDITLVRETRSLTLKVGVNRVQYSWAGTLIDPTSVEIRPLQKETDVDVLDTTFPGDKPQHLIWNIDSKIEGQVKFLVTYFTSGLSWSADYVLVSDVNESAMSFDGNVQIYNNSGEDYENAQVRVVVGVVNLVEKIKDLATRGLIPQPVAGAELSREFRNGAMKVAFDEADKLNALGYLGQSASRPAEIIKEGLSEYFIYTIEGAQDVPNQSSKRLSSFHARQVKFDIVYRLRTHQYGPRPVRFFTLKNDTDHKLGTTPLPDGIVRTFRDNGRDGLCFLGQEQVKYVPINADVELNVGTDDELVEEYKTMSVERSKFAFDRNRNVVGWDEKVFSRDEVRNYRAKPIRIEVRRVIDGDVTLDAEGVTLYDYHTAEFAYDVKPGEKFAWEYNYTKRLGTNAKQNRIALASASGM